MSRALSTAAKQAIFAPETDEVFLILVTISHPQLPAPLRAVNNTVNVTSRGDVFTAYPVRIDLPGESADEVARVQLQIDNVDRLILDTLRTLSEPPTVTVEVIMASTPDTVEAGPFAMTLHSAPYDALTVTGELAFEDILNEPFPGDTFSPALFPGLF